MARNDWVGINRQNIDLNWLNSSDLLQSCERWFAGDIERGNQKRLQCQRRRWNDSYIMGSTRRQSRCTEIASGSRVSQFPSVYYLGGF